MSALDLVLEKYSGTGMSSENTIGLKNYESFNELDCNCVDCGSDADCSTSW